MSRRKEQIPIPDEMLAKKGIVIGRKELPIKPITTWEIPADHPWLIYFNALNRPTDEAKQMRSMLTSFISNNTPFQDGQLSFTRGASAYFTYDPIAETVIVEWGKINPITGEGKLHDYLRIHLPYVDRVKQGMRLCSGHLAQLTAKSDYSLAFLERITQKDIASASKEDPVGKMINTLCVNNYIPLSAEAYVCLPIF